MKTTRTTILFAAVLAFASHGASAEDVETRIGKLSFTHDFANGYPGKKSVEKLYDEIDFQRGCQLYLWSLPLVSLAEWQKAHEVTFGAKSGDVVVYNNYLAKQGILTANATTPYIISFFNLAETGPVVIDMPGFGEIEEADDVGRGRVGCQDALFGMVAVIYDNIAGRRAEGHFVRLLPLGEGNKRERPEVELAAALEVDLFV